MRSPAATRLPSPIAADRVQPACLRPSTCIWAYRLRLARSLHPDATASVDPSHAAPGTVVSSTYLSLTKAAGDVSRIKLDRPFDAARRCGASCAVTKPFLAVLVGLAACSSGPKQPKPEPPKTDPVVTQPDPDPQPPQLAD